MIQRIAEIARAASSSISRPRSSGGRRRCARLRRASWRSKRSSGSPRPATPGRTWSASTHQVLEERGDDADTQRHRAARGWRASTRTSCTTTRAPRRRTCGCCRSIRRDARRAGRARSHLRQRGGMWQELAEILRRRIGVTTATDEIIELYFRLGRVYADALDDSAEAVRRYNAVLEQRLAQPARARGARARLLPPRAVAGAVRASTRRWSTSPPGDDGMADCYARMAQDRRRTAWTTATRRSTCGAASSTSAARIRSRSARWPTCTSGAEQWRELVDILERHGAHHRTSRRSRSRSTSGSAGSGARSCSRERNALEAWQKVLEIDPADLADAARAGGGLQADAGVGGAGRDAAQADRDRLSRRDMDAERADRAVRRARPAPGRDPRCARRRRSRPGSRCSRSTSATSARSARSSSCSRRRRAGRSASTSSSSKRAVLDDDDAAQVEVLLQAASTWEDKIGDRDRAGEVYERILQLDAQNLTASLQLEQIYRAQGKWEKLVELLLARVEFTRRAPAARRRSCRRSPRSTRTRSAIRRARSSCCRPRSARTTPTTTVSRRARAAGHGDQQVERAARRVHAGRAARSPDPKTAADLWVKIGRWYGEHLGHLEYAIALRAAGAAARAGAHRGARRTWPASTARRRMWPELVETLAAPRRAVETSREKKVELLPQHRRAVGRPARRSGAGGRRRTSRRSRPTRRRSTRSTRSSGCTARTEQWPRSDRRAVAKARRRSRTPRRSSGSSIRSGSSSRSGSATAQRAIETLQGDPVGRSAEHRGAQGARAALREDRRRSEKYLDVLEQQLDVTRHRRGAHLALRAHGGGVGGAVRQARPRLGGAREDRRHRRPHTSRRCELERLYRQERRSAELVETLRHHINAVNDPARAHRSLRADGPGLRGGAQRRRSRDRGVQRHPLASTPTTARALARWSRLYEKIERLGPRHRHRWRASSSSPTTPRTQVELYQRIGRIYEERLQRRRHRRGALRRGARARSGATCRRCSR